jgi:hypothetical protein
MGLDQHRELFLRNRVDLVRSSNDPVPEASGLVEGLEVDRIIRVAIEFQQRLTRLRKRKTSALSWASSKIPTRMPPSCARARMLSAALSSFGATGEDPDEAPTNERMLIGAPGQDYSLCPPPRSRPGYRSKRSHHGRGESRGKARYGSASRRWANRPSRPTSKLSRRKSLVAGGTSDRFTRFTSFGPPSGWLSWAFR